LRQAGGDTSLILFSLKIAFYYHRISPLMCSL